MSQENVDLVVQAMFPVGVDLAALTKEGTLAEAINVSVLAADFETAFATPSGPFSEYRGFDGFLEGWGDWMIPWATFAVHVDEFVDVGERVVALVTLRGRTAHDGVEIQQPGAAVFTVRGGKIVRVEFHLDQQEALAGARSSS